MNDPWKELRAECFGNVEPLIQLIAITTPKGVFAAEDPKGNIECIPAIAAGTSYNKEASTIEKAKILNRKLIDMGHLVPLESLSFSFMVTGISKSAGAQWSRHRTQSHVSLSRRYTKQRPNFIYPIFDYIEDEREVISLYSQLSMYCESSFNHYQRLLDSGIKKQDARLFMPVNVSTTRNAWANARALRDFFRLRLDPASEWEIRRIALLLLDIVYKETPSLFEDIAEKFPNR